MSGEVRYLDFADFLVIAEQTVGVPAEVLTRIGRVWLAESAVHAPAATFEGVEFYPDLRLKAAVLCWHLIRNHPLPDGNKRVAYLCMREFLARNGLSWRSSDRDPDETVEVMEAVAAGHFSIDELRVWIAVRTND